MRALWEHALRLLARTDPTAASELRTRLQALGDEVGVGAQDHGRVGVPVVPPPHQARASPISCCQYVTRIESSTYTPFAGSEGRAGIVLSVLK